MQIHRPLTRSWHQPFVLLVLSAVAAAPAGERAVPWDVAALQRAPAVEWLDRSAKVHSLVYEAEPYRGHATKVFAYYASPLTIGADPTPGKRYPAVVLAHGGMGGAYAAWAETLAKRGYAAIAPCLNGGDKHVAEAERGPVDKDDETVFFPKQPIAEKDHWQYHAVADLILAHSLVRGLPDVDADRTGIWGISWGGYSTEIVCGLDHRFKAAVAMYGCGLLHENGQWSYKFKAANVSAHQRDEWVRLWDPSSYVGSIATPILFINGGRDSFYPLDSYAKTYARVSPPKNISVQLDLRHAHIYDQREATLFLDQQLRGGTPLPKVTRLNVEGGKLTADVDAGTKLASGQLHYTTGPHNQNKSRAWESRPLTVDGNHVSGDAPPPEATAYFISLVDERGATVSSELTIK